MAASADEVRVSGDTMDLGRGPMKVFSTYDPAELDWEGCDVVLECTGKFNTRDAAAVHLGRGARACWSPRRRRTPTRPSSTA
jgi:glyceraldehyde 3-phosphate dehydrogenase